MPVSTHLSNMKYLSYELVTECCENSKYDIVTPKIAKNSSNYVFCGEKNSYTSLNEQDAQNLGLKK